MHDDGLRGPEVDCEMSMMKMDCQRSGLEGESRHRKGKYSDLGRRYSTDCERSPNARLGHLLRSPFLTRSFSLDDRSTSVKWA